MPKKPREKNAQLEEPIRDIETESFVSLPIITSELPRSVSSTDSQLADDSYRVGLYAEQVKLTRKNKIRQLLLWEDPGLLDIDKKVAEYLPHFSYQELKVYSAIERFISEQYKGQEDGEDLWVTFTPSEFYDYCGVNKNSGKQKEEYKQVLWSLSTQPKKIIQQQKVYKKNREVFETYILTTPLLTVRSADIIDSDTEEEAEDVARKALSNRDLPKRNRVTRYAVKPDEIMYKYLNSSYIKKTISQYDEIKALHPGTKPTKYTHLFLDYIQTLDFSPLNIYKKTLVEVMDLEVYFKQRKQTIVNNYIKHALEDALATRYILSYKEEPTGLLKVYLNPERCSRYADRLAKDKKEKI